MYIWKLTGTMIFRQASSYSLLQPVFKKEEEEAFLGFLQGLEMHIPHPTTPFCTSASVSITAQLQEEKVSILVAQLTRWHWNGWRRTRQVPGETWSNRDNGISSPCLSRGNLIKMVSLTSSRDDTIALFGLSQLIDFAHYVSCWTLWSTVKIICK